MKTIGFFHGMSEGNVLENFGTAIAPKLNQLGFNLVPVNLFNNPRLTENLIALIQKDPLFIFGYAGIGVDIKLIVNNKEVGFCEHTNIPLISLYGDSPSYREDLHIQNSRLQVGLYGFKEHLDFRKTLGNVHGTVAYGTSSILELNRPLVDIKTKRNGNLTFLKNNFSHHDIYEKWKLNSSEMVSEFLFDTSALLRSSFNNVSHSDIVTEVDNFIKSLNIFGNATHKLRLYLIRELDIYIRAYKANYLADILLDYPVQIHGSGWKHLDLYNKKGSIFSVVDYKKSEDHINNSLAQLSLSPNTIDSWHDRVLRSLGAKTLCLSNFSSQEVMEFQIPSTISYQLNEESIRSTIEWSLNHRDDVIDLGYFLHDKLSTIFSVEAFLANMINIVAILKSNDY